MNPVVVKPITAVFIPVLLVYLLFLVILSYISYKKTDSLKDFFIAGGTAGAFLTGSAYFATQFSMSSLMGVPGTLYNVGFAGQGIILSIAMFSMAFGVLVAGGRLQRVSRKLNLLTLPDYVASRYNSDFLRLLSALVIVVFLIPNMGAQIVGAGVIFNVFTGAPYWVGVVAMGVVVISYCMVGGMRAAILTDGLQGAVMVLAAIATFIAVAIKGGGLTNIMSELAQINPGAMSFPGSPTEYLTWKGYASQILMWTIFSIGQPQLINKYLAAKNYRSLLTGSIFSGVAMTLTCLTIWTAGVMAIVIAPGINQADWVMPTLLALSVSPVIASVIEAGILAAGMSTIDSMLVMVGGALSRDIYQKLIRKDISEIKVLQVARIMTVIAGTLAVVLAIIRPASIFQLVLFAWSGNGIVAIPIVVGLYWKRATKEGAIAGILTGIAVLLLSTFKFKAWALGFHPVVISGIVALLVQAVVSLMTPTPPTEVMQGHFQRGKVMNVSS